jgi:hypothetical protein
VKAVALRNWSPSPPGLRTERHVAHAEQRRDTMSAVPVNKRRPGTRPSTGCDPGTARPEARTHPSSSLAPAPAAHSRHQGCSSDIRNWTIASTEIPAKAPGRAVSLPRGLVLLAAPLRRGRGHQIPRSFHARCSSSGIRLKRSLRNGLRASALRKPASAVGERAVVR